MKNKKVTSIFIVIKGKNKKGKSKKITFRAPYPLDTLEAFNTFLSWYPDLLKRLK